MSSSKPFAVNTSRNDPYKTYRFLVYFGTDVTPVAGMSKVGAIKRESDVIDYKEGGNAIILKGLGRTKYDPITLERGVTHDRGFLKWASAVWEAGASPRHRRRDVRVELRSKAGRPAQRYTLLRCRVSEFRQRPAPDADRRGVAIDRIRLEYAGCERDFTPRVE